MSSISAASWPSALFVLTPLRSQTLLAALVTAGGLFGLIYYAITWHDTVRDGLNKKIDREDATWYAVLPVASYLFETICGVILLMRLDLGCDRPRCRHGGLAADRHPQCVGHHRLEYDPPRGLSR